MSDETKEVSMMRMEGYDDCIIGVSHRCGDGPILAYDYIKTVEKTVEIFGGDEEAAKTLLTLRIQRWTQEERGLAPCFVYVGDHKEFIEGGKEEKRK